MWCIRSLSLFTRSAFVRYALHASSCTSRFHTSSSFRANGSAPISFLSCFRFVAGECLPGGDCAFARDSCDDGGFEPNASGTDGDGDGDFTPPRRDDAADVLRLRSVVLPPPFLLWGLALVSFPLLSTVAGLRRVGVESRSILLSLSRR